MRIAICSDFYEPELSGVTDSLLLQGQHLIDMGHQLTFLVPSYPRRVYLARASQVSNTEAMLRSVAEVVRLPAMNYPFAPNHQSRIALPGLTAARRLHNSRPDIVHSHSPFVPGIIGLLAARRLGVPLVATHHTPFSEFMGRTPDQLVKLVERYVAWYYNHATFVSAPCRSLLGYMEQWGLRAPHAAVPNPVAVDDFSPARGAAERQAIRTRLGVSGFTLLCTGRLSAEKHVDLVIRAVARARKQRPDLNLAITGKGNAEPALRNLTEELGLEENVRFFGFLDYPTLVDLYKASDAFAMMSTAESQSLSLMQAMASGLPCLVANARAFPEYIDGGNGTLIEPGDFVALANELLRIARDPGYARKMAQLAIATVRDYAPDTIAHYWEDVYNRALAGKTLQSGTAEFLP